MKRVAVILVWLTLAVLWLCSGSYATMSGELSARTLPAGYNQAAVATFIALRDGTSIYEVPSQARVPAAGNAAQGLRLTPAMISLPALVSFARTTSYTVFLDFPLPKAARSVDFYVYGLRKIVI